MHFRSALLVLLPWTLLQAGWAAEAAPRAPKLYGRVEAIVCLNHRDALQVDNAALNARFEVLDRRVDTLQAEQAALIAEGRQVDTGNEAAVNAYNQRMEAIIARIDQHDAELEVLNRLRQALVQRGSAHNERCGNVVMDQFTMEAVRRERANPDPPAAEVRANRACNEMTTAFVAGQVDRYIRLLHPPLVERVGRDAVVAALRQSQDPGARPGFRLVDMDCAMPVQSSEAGGLQLLLLPVVLTADTTEGILKTESAFLGISADQGQTWRFVEFGPDPAMLKALLPEGLGSISPPQARMPMMYPR